MDREERRELEGGRGELGEGEKKVREVGRGVGGRDWRVGDVGMLGDVGGCWGVLGDVGGCWRVLGGVGGCWRVLGGVGGRACGEFRGFLGLVVSQHEKLRLGIEIKTITTK